MQFFLNSGLIHRHFKGIFFKVHFHVINIVIFEITCLMKAFELLLEPLGKIESYRTNKGLIGFPELVFPNWCSPIMNFTI